MANNYQGQHTGQEIDAAVDAVSGKQDQLTINESAGVVKVKIGTKTYALPGATELVTPATPTISKGGSDTDASRSISLACSTSGATIRYTTDGSTPTSASAKYTSAITISASATSTETTTTIKAKAFKNGEESALLTASVKTARHLANPTITANLDKYTTSRSVTISGATGSTLKDENDNTITSPKTITSTTTVKAKQSMSGWQDSDLSELEVVIGSPMTYIGCLNSTTINETQIKALMSDGLHIDGLATATAYNVTASATSYIWICQPNTLIPDNIFNDAQYSSKTGVENVVTVGSWNCYRTTNRVVAGNYSLYLKP